MGSESKSGVGGGGASQFLPGTKKVIQSLKEVVNCPEAEIYAVLKECNMDPNEAVQRLLSLDTFHEVKSKRERRKEMKETQDFRPRVYNGSSIRGVRAATEHITGSCGSTQMSYNELGKAAYKGQNGFAAPSPHPSIVGRTTNQQPLSHSDSFSSSLGSGDVISASAQPSIGNQSAWSTMSSGHFSMADIVKMGKNPSKGSHISSEISSLHQDACETNSFNYNVGSSQYSGDAAGQNALGDEWPVIEQSTAANGSSAINANEDAHTNRSNSYCTESNMLRDYQPDKVRGSEVGFNSENHGSDHSVSGRAKIVDGSSGRSYRVDSLSSNSSSCGSHRRTNENEEGKAFPNQSISDDVAVSSATINMQQLSLKKEEPEDQCTVVLPNNLQELAADCSHLSFGTYKSGNNTASRSQSFQNDLGGTYSGVDASFSGNSGYNHDELLGSLYDNGRATIDAKYYDFPANSQPELVKHDILEALGHKGITALPDFSSDNILRASSGMSFAWEEPKFKNVPPLQSDMAYPDSLRSDLLESTFQSLRGSDLPFSQLLGTPSMPSRYSSAVSSVNSSTISMSEALRSAALPLAEVSSVLPQHLTARSYIQPTYEQIANIIGYPTPPQSFSRTPASLQQAYVGGAGLHQSVSGMEYNLPQHRNGASISRVSPSAAGGGHGSFGTSTNVHGNYLHNSSVAPISNMDYDDVFRSQYKDGNHLNPLHQNQQYAGYRQEQAGQVPSQLQHYGSMGYPDLYNSQMGLTQERQRQSHNESGFGGIAGRPDLSPQQLHQIWQQTY
ncbi:uncharacterized protein LOC126798200 isoform X2 [Argentina anserina]|uniref:uncharacterized protein LOC126798200 isoform X2 n=1 Tax=Argentina anserina TaxID=57926 RepID=UPI00217631E9|nr:uncharacterized protein LOC126798200 isoform X2 [Potentilla anserina]